MTAASSSIKIWDPLVRLFHWGLAACFLLNYFVTEDGSDVHAVVGYVALGLLCVRLIWGFIGPTKARFSEFLPTSRGITHHLHQLRNRHLDATEGHNPAGGVMIFLLMTLILATGASGWALEHVDAFWGEDWAEELHEALANLTLAAVIVHVSAVTLIGRWTGVELIRPMITGKRRLSESETQEH